jgi:hypothetical protein
LEHVADNDETTSEVTSCYRLLALACPPYGSKQPAGCLLVGGAYAASISASAGTWVVWLFNDGRASKETINVRVLDPCAYVYAPFRLPSAVPACALSPLVVDCQHASGSSAINWDWNMWLTA